jgi:hypothetical protein
MMLLGNNQLLIKALSVAKTQHIMARGWQVRSDVGFGGCISWIYASGMERQSWFVKSAGVVLGVTGLAKALSAVGSARALDAADPLIGMPFRQLLLLVGLAELLIAFFCLFTERRRLSVLAVAWMCTNFLMYRLGLWFIGWHRPCGCMGNLTDILHISPRAADNIMKVLLAYLLFGSCAILLWQWRRERASLVAPAPKDLPVREPETVA